MGVNLGKYGMKHESYSYKVIINLMVSYNV